VALALFICCSAAVFSVALPLQRLDPCWQEALIAALLSNGHLPLIGLALSHLAVVLQPANRRLRHRFERFRQLAVVAAFGFLLLIPLQVSATWRGVQDSTSKASLQQQQEQQAISALRQIIKGQHWGAAVLSKSSQAR
jgi:predicted PurR-regulated permease PerM